MDEFLKRLQSQRTEFLVGGHCIAVIVLLTKETSHMNIALNECGRFFNQKGLRVKVKKYTSLMILQVKGKKSMKVANFT